MLRRWPASSGRPGSTSRLGSYREGAGYGGGASSGNGGGGNGNGGGEDPRVMAGLREAVTLLREATAMADGQTRAELQQAWAADRAWSSSATTRAATDAPAADAPSPDTHALFFEEAGLRAYDARRLARDLRRDVPRLASAPLRDLAAALAVLARAVPSAPPAELALRDARILAVPADVVVGCAVALAAAFPGRDAGQLILRCPRLVLQTAEALAEAAEADASGGSSSSSSSSSSSGAAAAAAAAASLASPSPRSASAAPSGAAAAAALSARVRAAMATLVRLHPSHDYDVVASAVAQEPGVLLRVGGRYASARLLDELPLEVQTAFVEADRGIGWLHKHWRRVRKEEEAARRRAAEADGSAAAAASGVPLSEWRSVVASSSPLPPLPEPGGAQSTLELDGPGSSPFDSPQATGDNL
jgi:hypothetical protein